MKGVKYHICRTCGGVDIIVLGEIELDILQTLKGGQVYNAIEMQERLDSSRNYIYQSFLSLERKGLVKGVTHKYQGLKGVVHYHATELGERLFNH